MSPELSTDMKGKTGSFEEAVARAEKLSREAARLRDIVAGIDKKLANENFLSRAPAEIVERERHKKESCLETLAKVESNMARLSV